MTPLDFQPLDGPQAREIIALAAPFIEPAVYPDGKTTVRSAPLPFLPGVSFCALTDTTLPEPNTRYVYLVQGNALPHDWTNEPIYKLNEVIPIDLAEEHLVPYVRFFFHFVRGQLGRFLIAEKPDHVPWLPEATDEEKAEVNDRLIPVTYRGVGPDGLHTLLATVVFKNALFQTKIKIAPQEMDVDNPETGITEHFTVGQIMLGDEELLLEELNVLIHEPPGEFG